MGGGGGKGGGGGTTDNSAQIKAYEEQQAELQKRIDEQAAQQKIELEKLQTDQQLQLKTQQEDLAKQKQEDLAKQKQEAYLSNQRATRDTLYSDRVSAEQTATDYVNSQIRQEQSNAAVFGMDYKISDEDKAKRISEYFSGIWNKADDDKLNSLFTEVGKPSSFTDFTVNISDSAATTATPSASVNVVATSKGAKPKPKATKELDGLLSSGSPLESLLG